MGMKLSPVTLLKNLVRARETKPVNQGRRVLVGGTLAAGGLFGLRSLFGCSDSGQVLTCGSILDIFGEGANTNFVSMANVRLQNGDMVVESSLRLPGSGEGNVRELREGKLILFIGTDNAMRYADAEGNLASGARLEACGLQIENCTPFEETGGALVPIAVPKRVSAPSSEDAPARAVGAVMFRAYEVDGSGSPRYEADGTTLVYGDYVVSGPLVDLIWGHDVYEITNRESALYGKRVVRRVEQRIPEEGPPEPYYTEIYYEVDEAGYIITPEGRRCLDEADARENGHDLTATVEQEGIMLNNETRAYAYYKVNEDGEFLEMQEVNGQQVQKPSETGYPYLDYVRDPNVSLQDIYQGNEELGLGGIENIAEVMLPLDVSVDIVDERQHRNAATENAGPISLGDYYSNYTQIELPERFTAGGTVAVRLNFRAQVRPVESLPETRYIYGIVFRAEVGIECEGVTARPERDGVNPPRDAGVDAEAGPDATVDAGLDADVALDADAEVDNNG